MYNHWHHEFTLRYLRTTWPSYALYLTSLLVHPMDRIVMPHLFSKMVESIRNSSSMSSSTRHSIYALIGLWLLMQIAFVVTGTIDAHVVSKFTFMCRTDLVSWMMDNLQCDPNSIHVESVMTKVLRFPETLRQLFVLLHQSVFVDIVMHAASLAYFAHVDHTVAIMYLSGLCAWATINMVYYVKGLSLSREQDAKNESYYSRVHDTFANISTVYTWGRVDTEVSDLKVMQSASTSLTQNAYWTTALYKLLHVVVMLVMFSAISIKTVNLVVQGNVSLSQFASLMFVILPSMSRLISGTSTIRSIQNVVGTVNNLSEFLHAISRPCRGKTPVSTVGDIVASDLKIRSSGRVVVDNLSTTILGGQMSVIIAPVGSGKSTFIRTLLRMHPIDKGSLWYGGYDISELDVRQWRKMFAVVPQNPRLLDRTVWDNLGYGDATAEEVIRMMNEYGLNLVASELLNKKNMRVGPGGSLLSGGQRQVICVFRAIASRAPIIIADEPTSSMDANTKEKVIVALRDAVTVYNRTVLIVSHDDQMEGVATNVVHLQ